MSGARSLAGLLQHAGDGDVRDRVALGPERVGDRPERGAAASHHPRLKDRLLGALVGYEVAPFVHPVPERRRAAEEAAARPLLASPIANTATLPVRKPRERRGSEGSGRWGRLAAMFLNG